MHFDFADVLLEVMRRNTGAMRAPLPESGVPGFYRLTLR